VYRQVEKRERGKKDPKKIEREGGYGRGHSGLNVHGGGRVPRE